MVTALISKKAAFLKKCCYHQHHHHHPHHTQSKSFRETRNFTNLTKTKKNMKTMLKKAKLLSQRLQVTPPNKIKTFSSSCFFFEDEGDLDTLHQFPTLPFYRRVQCTLLYQLNLVRVIWLRLKPNITTNV